MKKIILLLTACMFATPCFGETADDIFSPVPFGIKKGSLKDDSRFVTFNQKNSFSGQTSATQKQASSMFQPTKARARVELSYFKVVDDKRVFRPPVARDWDKEFLAPLPDDFNPLNRELLRLRPSLMLDEDWKLTLQKVKVKDGSLEGRFILEKKF